MNQTEKACNALLALRLHAGEILWFRFEGLRLRLADNTFYSPDFAVLAADSVMQCHEVKGHWTDDARAKINIAADMYPFRFLAVKKGKKAEGGGWIQEDF
jgi:hypothetical protein